MASQVYAQGYATFFLEPQNNSTVHSPFRVRFAVEGMVVRPAGDMMLESGHFQILVNKEDVEQGAAVPFGDGFIHFGAGQTEALLSLPHEKYRLSLQFADGAHLSYGKMMRETIDIVVE